MDLHIQDTPYKIKKLWYKGKLVISKTSPKVQTLTTEYHSSVVGGHSGFFITFKRIAASVVTACETCQQNKYQALSPACLLQPLPIPTQVWSDISGFYIGSTKSTRKERNSGCGREID